MYSNYGGIPNAAGPPFNGAPPPGSQNSQPPGQQMMYNPQQFPMTPQGPGAGAFPGAHGMMPGANPAMMQNAAMASMPNGQMPNYQAQYANAQYGGMVGASMNVQPNYAMGGGGMPMGGFQMQPGMAPQQQQHMMQRMQNAHPNPGAMSTPTGQRPFPGQPPQGTPGTSSAPPQQPQFSTPQSIPPPTPQNQTPTPVQGQGPQQQQQQQPPQQALSQQPGPPTHGNPGSSNNNNSNNNSNNNNIATPQTPTFPSAPQGNATNGSSGSTPMSPGADSRDKERVQTILEINNELLLEAIQLQNTQQALKKERTEGSGNEGDKKPSEEEELLGQDYVQCMRRLQSNLTYLAALADKKSQSQAAPSPAHLKAPILNTRVKLKPVQAPEGGETKTESADREETSKYLHELYKRLQGLYPGIDPNKEPQMPMAGARPGKPGPNMSNPGSQTPGQASPVTGGTKTPQMATSAPPQNMPNSAMS